MAKYKKCPRCELNWIPVEEELCEVCKAELGKASSISLIEDDEDGAYEEERVCPVCKVNYLADDEDMCAECRAKKAAEKAAEKPEEEDESWKEFVGEDSADDLEGDDAEISLSLLQEEEESYSDEPDDFDESITAFDENDYDEDEEDDDDEDDDI